MNTLRDRLNKLISELGLSKNEFAREIGTSSAMISKITTKDVNFGVDIFQKIISAYPSLNHQWLLNGNGKIWSANQALETSFNPSLEKINHNYEPQEYPQITATPSNKTAFTKDIDAFKKKAKIFEKNRYRLLEELRNTNKELSDIYSAVRHFEGISDKISVISNTYFSDLDFTFIWDDNSYLNGEQFNYTAFRKDVFEQLEKLKPFKQSISKFLAAYDKFEAEFEVLDVKNVIDNFK